MTRPVLFTGGSGLLAVNWAWEIRYRHDVVLGLHDRAVCMEDVRSEKLDLASPDHLAKTISVIQPGLVIHTAALTNVVECEANPARARRINVDLAVNVAEVCAKFGIPLIHISTDHLFSGEKPMVGEDEPVSPMNVYGKTKGEAEKRVLDIHPKSLVLRTNFYGWGPQYRRSFSDFVVDALRAKRGITLYDDVFYTPILISRLVSVAHQLWDKQACGVFHVVGDQRLSKYEFGIAVAREFGLDASLIARGAIADRADAVRRPRDMSLSNSKVANFIGESLGDVREQLSELHRHEQRASSMVRAA